MFALFFSVKSPGISKGKEKLPIRVGPSLSGWSDWSLIGMGVLLVWAAVEEEGMSHALCLPVCQVLWFFLKHREPVGQPGAKHPPWFLVYFPVKKGTFHLGPLGCCPAVLSQTRRAGHWLRYTVVLMNSHVCPSGLEGPPAYLGPKVCWT